MFDPQRSKPLFSAIEEVVKATSPPKIAFKIFEYHYYFILTSWEPYTEVPGNI